MQDSKPRRSAPVVLLIWAAKALWTAFVVFTPILGVWGASSMAAYANASLAVAFAVGLVLFPLGPLFWEWRAARKFRRKVQKRKEANKKPPQRYLSFWDRMTLRTLVVNLAFLALWMAAFPQEGFVALSARGDWMLEQQEGTWVEPTRRTLFSAAEGLEWLYDATRENPYEVYAEDDKDSGDKHNPTPNEFEPSDKTNKEDPKDTSTKADRTTKADTARPIKAELHHAVVKMPASAEKSIASVARYLAKAESDPYLRVKALHDYVADRIAYDAPALEAGLYPPQDPETVFRTRKAVCAGYAKLFKALGDEIGEEIVYVVGHTRRSAQRLDGQGHAWNAVKIKGQWYLVDVTWDAGWVKGAHFEKSYETSYFLTPPRVMTLDHFPDDEKWQLRTQPISRGEFLRQPILHPEFFKQDLELITPKRSQISASDKVTVALRNPRGRYMLASLVRKDAPDGSAKDDKHKCKVKNGSRVQITCAIPHEGTWKLRMFAGPKQYNSRYSYVGGFEVNAR